MIAKFIGCMDTIMVNMNIGKVKTLHPTEPKKYIMPNIDTTLTQQNGIIYL